MKRYLLVLLCMCILTSCSVMYKIVSWEDKTYNHIPWKDFPFLTNIAYGYYIDNYSYPQSTEDILKFWNLYKKSSQEMLTNRTIKLLDNITFKRLSKESENFIIKQNDSIYMILYKQDTIWWSCHCEPGVNSLRMRRMKDFLYVSMHRNDTYGMSVATEVLTHKFNRGIYDLVSKEFPEFKENRIQKRDFKIVVLQYEAGVLFIKTPTAKLNFSQNILYNDLLRYCSDFATQNNFAKIIFNYIYD